MIEQVVGLRQQTRNLTNQLTFMLDILTAEPEEDVGTELPRTIGSNRRQR